jgi:adenylate kinase
METLTLGFTILISALAMTIFATIPITSEPLVVILLGPPGSGKGTQAVKLSQKLGIPHLSTGDLFRENIGKGTDLGKKAKTFMDAGKLVPDEIVLDMLFERVKQSDCMKGYLLDGFPRTIPQAEALDLKLAARAKIIALNLDVGDELIVKRIEGRLSCKNCGNIQNKYFSKPHQEGKCDKCGGELVQRSDDKEEVVKERLRVYHHQTEPLVGFYSNKAILTNINGERPPEVVAEDLFNQLK